MAGLKELVNQIKSQSSEIFILSLNENETVIIKDFNSKNAQKATLDAQSNIPSIIINYKDQTLYFLIQNNKLINAKVL